MPPLNESVRYEADDRLPPLLTAGLFPQYAILSLATMAGTVLMSIPASMAPIIARKLEDVPTGASEMAAPVTGVATLTAIAFVALRFSGVWCIWSPAIGLLVGCGLGFAFGIYDVQRVAEAPWVGLPDFSAHPGLDLGFGGLFWGLLPGFIIVTLVGAMDTLGDSIAIQRASWRRSRAIDLAVTLLNGVLNLASPRPRRLCTRLRATALGEIDRFLCDAARRMKCEDVLTSRLRAVGEQAVHALFGTAANGLRRILALLVAFTTALPCLGATVVDVPLFKAASHPTQQGFIRISSLGAAGTVEIHAYDDAGMYRFASVELAADATIGLNSHDLEQGNRRKGLTAGIGTGSGDWTLQLRSDMDFKAGSYMRTIDGFLTSMGSALLPKNAAALGLGGKGCAYEANIFNPASNFNQRSWLRLINYDFKTASVEVTGVDDAGERRGPVIVSVPPGEVRSVTSVQLERGGAGLTGSLGDGQGKWRLTVFSTSPLTVMNLLETPTGHLTNLGPTAAPGVSDAVQPLDDVWCDSAPTFVISRGR